MNKPNYAAQCPNGTIVCRDGIRRNSFLKTPAESRFWKFVDKKSDDECWLWTGNKCGSGYKYAAFWDGENQVKGHRFSYELKFGKIPKGMFACHKCDTPLCVNPNHIFAGTSKDNCADMVRKNRMTWRAMLGEDNPRSKWSSSQVLKAIDLWRSGCQQKEVAKLTGISFTSVASIVQGRVWNHITGLPVIRKTQRLGNIRLNSIAREDNAIAPRNISPSAANQSARCL